MAIGIRSNGTWTAGGANAQSTQIAIPETPQAGDLMLLAATVKPYSHEPSVDQDWLPLISESGGTTANGNGAGSTRLCVFYKIHDGTAQTDPTVSWGGQSSPGLGAIVVLSKASNEGWDLQQLSAATETAMGNTALSTNLTTTAAIQNGDWVWALVGAADDSATFTRATTAISGAAVTWNGNHVEEPATHASTTNGNDGAADLGYRAVTTGTASGATITVTATLSAAERVNSVLFRVGVDPMTTVPGSFTANAVLRATAGGLLNLEAEIGSGSTTETGDFTADAVTLAEAAGDFGADAATLATAADTASLDATILREQAGSFSADAVIPGEAGTIEDSVIADAEVSLVGVPAWVSPANNDPITSTPVLVFTMPQATGKLWFNLQLDKADTFDGPDLRDLKTTTDQTGWEYWDGDSWEPFPADGVPGAFSGNEARYTVSPSLPSGTWYRRIRAGTTR